MSSSRKVFFGALVSLLGALVSCAPPPSTSLASPVAAPTTEASPPDDDGERERGPDAVRAIYDGRGPAVPAAEALCRAFQEVPRRRKAECCEHRPGILLTGECTRVLSAAITTGAVSLDEGAARRCEAAMAEAHEGCGWVGTWSRAQPEACQALLEGHRKDGETCRSSVECEAGLRCHGVSPTDEGVCGPPEAVGATCGDGVDPLAGYVGADLARGHPECASGFCANGRCRALAAVGERCVSDEHCGAGAHCDRSTTEPRCAEGARTLAPPAHDEGDAGADLSARCAMR